MRYMDGGGKRAVWCVHRRGGKDLTALHQTCKMMLQRKGSYWHVFPTAEQGRKAIWEGFTKEGERTLEQVFPSPIRKSPREWRPSGEMIVELVNGSIWRLMGSDRMEVVGAGPVGVVFSEFALAKPSTWDLVRPMLRENDGHAVFASTPRGANHFKQIFDVAGTQPGWWRELQSLRDTGAYDYEKTVAEELASGMPQELIDQEYGCSWTAALVGSVYGKLMEDLEKRGSLSAFDHPNDGCFSAWDLGVSDATAIWIWRTGASGGVDVLAHYEASGQPLSHFLDWIDAQPYRFVRHFLPHDARARTLQTGVSLIEQFAARVGNDRVAIGPELSMADGIQATRWLLQQTTTRIHERCASGIEALKQYHYNWDRDDKAFSKKPVHDWSSHSADGARYMACVVKASELMQRKPPPKPEFVLPANPVPTLDELFSESDSQVTRYKRT